MEPESFEKHSLGFPQLEHYDTWLEDVLQGLYLSNYGKRRHKNWVSASNYQPTTEKLGVTNLLGCQPEFPKMQVLPKLSRDLKYLAECQGLPAPCLPVTSKQEKSLFTKLAPRCGSDFKAMSVKWAAESDGKQVLNRTHFRVLTDWFQQVSTLVAAEMAAPVVDTVDPHTCR